MQNNLHGQSRSDAHGAKRKENEGVVPHDQRQLEEILKSARIPVVKWGRGEAKDMAALWNEIDAGETKLRMDGGRLTRHIRAVNVYVLYLSADDRLYELKEVRQVFKDGRERRRTLNCSISEKGKPDEDAEVTARRALAEELGISAPLHVRLIGREELEHHSHSYPGLPTHAEIITFCANLSDREYRPEGYVEKGAELTSYFSWQLVPAHLR